MKVNLLLLANSIKMGERCIAGIDVDSGKWIRPVINNESRSVPNILTEISGVSLRPGDLVEIEVGKPMPLPHHPEDVELVGSIALVKKSAILDFAVLIKNELAKPNQLLESARDRYSINEIAASSMQNSLAISLGRNIRFFEDFGKKRVRFESGGVNWSLAQTDDKRTDFDPLPEALICISLGEPFERTNAHHKLAAGIISTSNHEIDAAISSGIPNLSGSLLPLPELASLIAGGTVEIESDERLQGRIWFYQTDIGMNCLRCDHLGIHVLRSHEIAVTSKGSRVLHRFALFCQECNYVFSTPLDKTGYGDRLREAVEKKLPVKKTCSMCL